MSKTDHKKRSIIPWDSIIVYNDDKKSIKEYKLNEEQRLLIPIKSIRRKHMQKSSSKNEQKKQNENNDSKDKCIDNKLHLEYAHQEIFSRKGCISDSFNELLQQIYKEFSSDSIFDCNFDDEMNY